jgi:hypothetical protein
VPGAVVDCEAVLLTGVEAGSITVLVVVDPHDASARSAPAARRTRLITRGSICGPEAPAVERAVLLS